jgi:cyanophycinase
MISISTKRGLLYLIGGAEDRHKDTLVLKQMIEWTRPKVIVIIPTASSYPQSIERDYTDVFRRLGVQIVQCLDIRYRDEADRDENLKAVETADLIFFGGGDQVRLVDILHKTRFIDLIRRRFESGRLHIAGTSAGATAAGNPMIFNGNNDGLAKGSVEYAGGFGLVDGVAIDTHFYARGRLARLSQFLISGHCRKGIGLDEDTGIMICPDFRFKVIGSGMVTVLNSASVSGSNFPTVGPGDYLRFNNMRYGILPAGSIFSIRRWSIVSRISGKDRCLSSPRRLAAN